MAAKDEDVVAAEVVEVAGIHRVPQAEVVEVVAGILVANLVLEVSNDIPVRVLREMGYMIDTV